MFLVHPGKAAGLGAGPDIPHAVQCQGKDIRMRHSIDWMFNTVLDTKKPCAGAHENRSVAILDDAGDELRFEQVRLSLWIDLARGKVEETRIGANPKTSATIWKDGADGVAGRLDTKQVVIK